MVVTVKAEKLLDVAKERQAETAREDGITAKGEARQVA